MRAYMYMILNCMCLNHLQIEAELRFRWVDQCKMKIVSSECIITRIIGLIVKSYDVARRDIQGSTHKEKISQRKDDIHNRYYNICMCVSYA